jgi:hypothetical protein
MASPLGTPKRRLLPPPAQDDSSRHRIANWFKEASGRGQLLGEGRMVGTSAPAPRIPVPCIVGLPAIDRRTGHALTDGSFHKSAGLGWAITDDDRGARPFH